jgi:hypothetical protein
MTFRRLLKSSNVDAKLVATWEKAYLRKRTAIKSNTRDETRSEIIKLEAEAFAALTLSLDVHSETAVRVMSVQATGEDSNARIQHLENAFASLRRKVDSTASQTTDIHTVMIKGESIGGSGIARKAQIRAAKASLTTEFQAASSASKDEMNDLMQAQLDRMRQLKAESVDARLAALSGDETLLLSLAPLFAEAKANAKAMAKAAAKRVADAKAAAKRAAVAKPQQRTLDAGFDVD